MISFLVNDEGSQKNKTMFSLSWEQEGEIDLHESHDTHPFTRAFASVTTSASPKKTIRPRLASTTIATTPC